MGHCVSTGLGTMSGVIESSKHGRVSSVRGFVLLLNILPDKQQYLPDFLKIKKIFLI